MASLVLIAEDDAEIFEVLNAYLEREGFRTVRAGDGRVAIDLHSMLKPDLILLDVTMPKLDGWEVLAEVRRRGGTPVIMITALDKDVDRLLGLRLGADDYVVKPFNPIEVVARAKAVLRRAGIGSGSGVLRIDQLTIDLDAYTASIEDGQEGKSQTLQLTLTEFRILAHMAKAPMKVFSRAEIVDVCSPGGDTLDRTIDSHISHLRRKLGQAGAADLMSGVRGVGYRLARSRL